MRVRILASAHNDLVDGYWFYERQGEGLHEPVHSKASLLNTVFPSVSVSLTLNVVLIIWRQSHFVNGKINPRKHFQRQEKSFA